ncbi:MAG: hypothetical protein IKT39_03435 [Clostridia bacterium]|nr:hypothetical protein [Clostridia bacterium]
MIKDRKNLTLFRYDAESGGWTSFYIKNALIHNCRGIHEGLRGVKYAGQSIIRVKIKNPNDVYCGDKIAVGLVKGECPPDAMTVTGVTDNGRGTSYVRHIKITCEG